MADQPANQDTKTVTDQEATPAPAEAKTEATPAPAAETKTARASA